MKIFILLALFSLSAFAEIFEVHSVSQKENETGAWIVKFTDGRVGFWNHEDNSLLDAHHFSKKVIEARLSQDHVLTDVIILGPIEPTTSSSGEKNLLYPPYTPTVYSNYNYATDVLNRMRRQWSGSSQCYDRSHVWAYEEAYYGRFLQKAFLFFSDSYISRYSFPWWFHTAPYALVRMGNENAERIMDPGFSQYPLKFKLWTDLFMKNKVECKLIQKYSQYSRRPGEDDCYLIKTSIYFWQPKDLEAFENSGVEKKKFIDWEIRHAYKYGFGLTN